MGFCTCCITIMDDWSRMYEGFFITLVIFAPTDVCFSFTSCGGDSTRSLLACLVFCAARSHAPVPRYPDLQLQVSGGADIPGVFRTAQKEDRLGWW